MRSTIGLFTPFYNQPKSAKKNSAIQGKEFKLSQDLRRSQRVGINGRIS